MNRKTLTTLALLAVLATSNATALVDVADVAYHGRAPVIVDLPDMTGLKLSINGTVVYEDTNATGPLAFLANIQDLDDGVYYWRAVVTAATNETYQGWMQVLSKPVIETLPPGFSTWMQDVNHTLDVMQRQIDNATTAAKEGPPGYVKKTDLDDHLATAGETTTALTALNATTTQIGDDVDGALAGIWPFVAIALFSIGGSIAAVIIARRDTERIRTTMSRMAIVTLATAKHVGVTAESEVLAEARRAVEIEEAPEPKPPAPVAAPAPLVDPLTQAMAELEHDL